MFHNILPTQPRTMFERSQTLPTELWKNPLLSIEDRLEAADGAVAFEHQVNKNLRARLEPKRHCQWIEEYPGDVFVVYDPMTDGCHIMGACRTLDEAKQMLKDIK